MAKKSVIFVDVLSFFSLFRIVRSFMGGQIYYFDRVTPAAERISRVLHKIGIRCDYAKVPCYYAEMRDHSCVHFLDLRTVIDETLQRMFKETFSGGHLLERIHGRLGELSHVRWFFSHRFDISARPRLMQIALAAWCGKRMGGPCVMLCEYSGHVAGYSRFASERGTAYREYATFRSAMNRWPLSLVLFSRQLLWFAARHLANAMRGALRSSASPSRPEQTCVVQHYTGSALHLSPAAKSELFWLDACSIPPERVVLVECDRPKFEPGSVRSLKEKGVRVYGHNAEADHWLPTPYRSRLALQLLAHLAKGVWSAMCARKAVRIRDIKTCFLLLDSFSYWKDFYRRHHAGLITSFFFHDVSAVLAIQSEGGVSAIFQDSISGFDYHAHVHAPSHIVCNISRHFMEVYRQSRQGSLYLATGYSYSIDRVLQGTRDWAEALKAKLKANGAEFILCFFDENFTDQWRFGNPEEVVDAYRLLFEMVVDDPTLGLICKPKQPSLIDTGLASIRETMDRALETGRCRIFRSDQNTRAVYPASVAAAADCCIGDTCGCSASLEAFLAGKPAVLHDRCVRPFNSLGPDLCGKVVFPDMRSLADAVQAFRKDPGEVPGFGDWTPWLEALVVRAGKGGTESLASLFEWLLERTGRGGDSRELLDGAGQWFAGQWGRDKVLGPEEEQRLSGRKGNP